jgi:RNA polymerase sigma-70 factor, ECF subfamily
MAEIATGNKDEALDILQDAMFKLTEKYADRNSREWGALFTTILQSRIRDWYRRNQVRNRFRSWFSNKDAEQEDPIQQAQDEKARTPEQLLQSNRRVDELGLAIHALPLRQQQAFLLRTWEGYSVEETANIMKCSAGSVKTHYSRAVHALRDKLEKHWE